MSLLRLERWFIGRVTWVALCLTNSLWPFWPAVPLAVLLDVPTLAEPPQELSYPSHLSRVFTMTPPLAFRVWDAGVVTVGFLDWPTALHPLPILEMEMTWTVQGLPLVCRDHVSSTHHVKMRITFSWPVL